MFNRLFKRFSHKPLNILIVESNQCDRAILGRNIELNRPNQRIYVAEHLEQVFSLIYSEVKLGIIFFDVESPTDIENLTMIQAISTATVLIYWSNSKHPEVIELLYGIGINSFCLKDSKPHTITEAIDLAQTNPKILYIDERLGECLPLLAR